MGTNFDFTSNIIYPVKEIDFGITAENEYLSTAVFQAETFQSKMYTQHESKFNIDFDFAKKYCWLSCTFWDEQDEKKKKKRAIIFQFNFDNIIFVNLWEENVMISYTNPPKELCAKAADDGKFTRKKDLSITLPWHKLMLENIHLPIRNGSALIFKSSGQLTTLEKMLKLTNVNVTRNNYLRSEFPKLDDGQKQKLYCLEMVESLGYPGKYLLHQYDCYGRNKSAEYLLTNIWYHVMNDRTLQSYDVGDVVVVNYNLQRLAESTCSNGIEIAGEIYHEFGSSNSKFCKRGSYFYRGSKEEILSILKTLGQFERALPAKIAARIGLNFTSVLEGLFVHDLKVEDDIMSADGKYNFTDGCGQMSRDFAVRLMEHLKWKRLPIAIQFRYPGCKGVLVLDDKLKDYSVVLRKSQQKVLVPLNDKSFADVIKMSAPVGCKLNKNVIEILCQNASKHGSLVRKRVENKIRDYFNASVQSAIDAVVDPVKFVETLKWLPKYMDYSQMKSYDAESLQSEAFLRQMVQADVLTKLRFITEKQQITIPNEFGRIAVGAADFHGYLKQGQVFFRYSKEPSVKCEEKLVHVGPIAVTRSPSFSLGDIQFVEAVDVPELHHIVDVLIFPTCGDRPIQDKISGGDLDGDEYFIFWDPDLMLPYSQPGAEFIHPKPEECDKINLEQIQDHFPEFLGAADFRGYLKQGQVFFRYSKEPSVKCEEKLVHVGPIAVTRSPSFSLGDIQFVEAVDIPELHHIVDVLIFPTCGDRPIQDKISGGDLDGDEYFVFWDPDLMLPFSQPGAEFIHPKPEEYAKINLEQIQDHFPKFRAEYMQKDNVGAASNNLTIFAEILGYDDEDVRNLALKVDIALIYFKSGIAAEPLEGFEQSCFDPNHMLKDRKPMYQLKNIIGTFHQSNMSNMKIIEEIRESDELKPKIDELIDFPGWEKWTTKAELKFEVFKSQVDMLLIQNNLRSTGELFSNRIFKYLARGQDVEQISAINPAGFAQKMIYDLMKESRIEILTEFVPNWKELRRKKKGEFFDFYLSEISNDLKEYAVACYRIAYENGKYLAFPWIFWDVLDTIRSTNQAKNVNKDDSVMEIYENNPEIPLLLMNLINDFQKCHNLEAKGSLLFHVKTFLDVKNITINDNSMVVQTFIKFCQYYGMEIYDICVEKQALKQLAKACRRMVFKFAFELKPSTIFTFSNMNFSSPVLKTSRFSLELDLPQDYSFILEQNLLLGTNCERLCVKELYDKRRSRLYQIFALGTSDALTKLRDLVTIEIDKDIISDMESSHGIKVDLATTKIKETLQLQVMDEIDIFAGIYAYF
uniref:RNA-dependent RNA polymerase n=1 Tax=Panagrolaimus sp. JU765 TaxID=591449 RepID=A0AC34QZN5_9BILA